MNLTLPNLSFLNSKIRMNKKYLPHRHMNVKAGNVYEQ